MSEETFNEGYYMTGNYADYFSRTYDGLAADIESILNVHSTSSILDYGCGCGSLLAALSRRGFCNLVGTDISAWAIDYGRQMFPQVELQHYSKQLLDQPHGAVLVLDVLEHMPEHEAKHCVRLASGHDKVKILVRIPVSAKDGEPFVLDVSNKDKTHILCRSRKWWYDVFKTNELDVTEVNRPNIYNSEGVIAALLTR